MKHCVYYTHVTIMMIIHIKNNSNTRGSLNICLECHWALVGVAQLVGRHSANQKVTSLIPHQGTYLGCRFEPWLGRFWEGNQSMFLTSMFLFLPSPLSKIKYIKSLKNRMSLIISKLYCPFLSSSSVSLSFQWCFPVFCLIQSRGGKSWHLTLSSRERRR